MSLDRSVLGTGRPVHLLVTLEFAGVTWRVATGEIDIADGAATYHYTDGVIDATPDQGIDVYDQGGGVSMPVELLLPVDVAALVSRGHTLASAPCEVALWVDGSTWAERHVLVLGTLTDPEVGEEGEPIAATVEAVLYEDTTEPVPLPASDLIVDGVTWPEATSLSPGNLGTPYTVLIGRPGTVSTAISSTGWVPAFRVKYAANQPVERGGPGGNWSGTIILFAGHHVGVSRAWVANTEIPDGIRVKVRDNWDREGHPVAWLPWWSTASSTPADEYLWDSGVVTYTWAGGTPDSDAVTTYTVGFNSVNGHFDDDDLLPTYAAVYDSIDGGGGLQWRGRELRGAGDVVEWAMTNAGGRVDYGRCEMARPFLAGIKIDGAIEAQTSYWEWLASEILPLLPVFLAESSQGKYYGVWRVDARAADATLRLDADADPRIQRRSRRRFERAGSAKAYQLDYAWDALAGEFCARARLDVNGTVGGYTSYVIAIADAETAAADVTVETLESKFIYDDASALQILAMRAETRTRPRETIDYSFPLHDYHYPDVGEIVSVTDARVSLSARPGLIQRVWMDSAVDVVYVSIWLGGDYELDRRS